MIHLGLLALSSAPAIGSIPLTTRPVLMPDPMIGRQDPVLHGVVMVRFRPEHIVTRQQFLSPLPFKLIRAEPLLRWEHSLRGGARQLRPPTAHSAAAIRAEEPLLRTFIVEYAEAWHPEQVCRVLQSYCPAVEVAEPYVINLPCFTPNDPLLPRQQLLWTINAFNGWELARGDSTVVIGIVDTGVLYTHEDLFSSLWYNRSEIPDNGVDDDGNGYVDDYLGYNFATERDGTPPGDPRNRGEGHGTGVAGIAAATVNNAKGIAGIAYRCRFFPIKAAPEGVPAIYYGYQGILYSALMGFAVVNCSWGSQTYSCINRSVVEYATARGTLVVASAGNTPVSTTAWYPAGYPGVLGVGNTYPDDHLQPQSAYGIGATLLAPGEGAWTTSNDRDDAYTTFGGTSAAAPIVAGAAALLRALRPQLGPLQVLALLRRTADDIRILNPDIAAALPGRLNLWAALATPPEEALGLVLPELLVRSAEGRQRRRWQLGDTLWLWIRAHNVLGDATNIICTLHFGSDSSSALRLLDTLCKVPTLPAASPCELGPFRAVVTATSADPVLLRLELRDSSGEYRDALFVTLVPTPTTMTFANGTAEFSVADDGALGFADYPTNAQGSGFRYREVCSLLYGGGLLATDSLRGRAVSAAPSGFTRDRDFAVLKPFVEPNEELNLISDANASPGSRIGLTLQQRFLGFVAESSGVAGFLVTVWNTAGIPLRDITIGYVMDWDLSPAGRSDRVRLFPEAEEPTVELPHGAEVIEHSGSPIVGACAVALTPEAEVQRAGFSTALLYDGDGLTTAEKLRLLNSGNRLQYDSTGDVALAVGVRFRGVWEPNQQRQFLFCFGAAESPAALAELFRECARYARTLPSPEPISQPTRLAISHHDGFLIGELPAGGVWTLEVWDLLGRCLWREALPLFAGPIRLPLPASTAGVLLVRLSSVHSLWHQIVVRLP
ncbi:MAG: S8 family serine peptidase [Bacteroidota bacterium]|nr:S8 family serine peptidase [Bacteroidota bacterium]